MDGFAAGEAAKVARRHARRRGDAQDSDDSSEDDRRDGETEGDRGEEGGMVGMGGWDIASNIDPHLFDGLSPLSPLSEHPETYPKLTVCIHASILYIYFRPRVDRVFPQLRILPPTHPPPLNPLVVISDSPLHPSPLEPG